jgi:LPXTG-motif cell wall-anchored protein
LTSGIKGERMQRIRRSHRQGGNKLKKIMLLAAMLAMVLVTAAPALAWTKSATATSSAKTATASMSAASVQYKKTVTATPTAAAAQYQYKTTVTALPKTGGPGPSSGVLALGAGALLVGGGLVARRIVR